VLGFAAGVVLVVLLGSFLYDSSKTRSDSESKIEIPEPLFPVPEIPTSQSEVIRG
jgi:hypothetical protein